MVGSSSHHPIGSTCCLSLEEILMGIVITLIAFGFALVCVKEDYGKQICA
jgi:hypothetical protein